MSLFRNQISTTVSSCMQLPETVNASDQISPSHFISLPSLDAIVSPLSVIHHGFQTPKQYFQSVKRITLC